MTNRLGGLVGLAALAALATGGAARAADVSLDNVAVKGRSDKSTIVIKHVDVKGSSLSADEVRKLLSGELAAADEKALAAKFNADSLSAPEIDVTSPEATTTIHGIAASTIAAGRIAKADIAGADVVTTAKGGGGHVGALHVEGLNLSRAVGSADKTMASGYGGLTALSFAGADLQIPEGDKDGAPLMHVVVGPATFAATYDGAFPTKEDFSFKGATVSFAPGSENGAKLKAFGYDKVEVSAASNATCDKTARSCNGVLTLTWPGAAALTVKGTVGNLPAEPGSGDAAAAMAQTVSNFELSLANSGLVEKALDSAAKQRHTDAAALKAQAGQMTAMIPMMLGDADTGKKLGDALAAFLGAPKNLTVSIKAKAAPASFAELSTIRKPADLLARYFVDARANQ